MRAGADLSGWAGDSRNRLPGLAPDRDCSVRYHGASLKEVEMDSLGDVRIEAGEACRRARDHGAQRMKMDRHRRVRVELEVVGQRGEDSGLMWSLDGVTE